MSVSQEKINKNTKGYVRRHSTMPTLNSCTKCVGSPGIIHDWTPDCHRLSLAWVHG